MHLKCSHGLEEKGMRLSNTKNPYRISRQGSQNKVYFVKSSTHKYIFIEFSKLCFFLPGKERDMKMPSFCIKICTAIPEEFDRCSHFFKNFKVIVEASFGDTDIFGGIIALRYIEAFCCTDQLFTDSFGLNPNLFGLLKDKKY
jgi:hypothetical protein